MQARGASRLRLIAAAALFSTGGAAIKACDLSSWQIAGARSAIAALAFLVLVPEARRAWSRAEWCVGIVYAATLVLFVQANKLTTAANTIFLQSTAPLYVLLLGPWLLRERIRGRDVAYLCAAGAGLAMFFLDVDEPRSTAPDPWRGNLLALASGLGWALTVIGLRWLSPRTHVASPRSAVGAVVAGNVLAFVACLPRGLPLDHVAASDVLVLVYLGVFQIALAYVFVTRAVRDLEAFEVSVLLLVEPVLNPVWAWIVHGEVPGFWSLCGGALIVAATLARTLWEARERSGANVERIRSTGPARDRMSG